MKKVEYYQPTIQRENISYTITCYCATLTADSNTVLVGQAKS